MSRFLTDHCRPQGTLRISFVMLIMENSHFDKGSIQRLWKMQLCGWSRTWGLDTCVYADKSEPLDKGQTRSLEWKLEL
ncbi:hypothetical protein BLL42_27520 (plasmid) [Pseudomonas frederiksbergensis]|uniref:Uncharacterized protein n=1 Tax=Pseudomonas frederiksbergensis TaxID=104087 RepID=A0A1J0EUA7_9PSED|nr:hypothetical protein BLL42_27520 [Pseudomonas frederiksbergensis]